MSTAGMLEKRTRELLEGKHGPQWQAAAELARYLSLGHGDKSDRVALLQFLREQMAKMGQPRTQDDEHRAASGEAGEHGGRTEAGGEAVLHEGIPEAAEGMARRHPRTTAEGNA